MSAVPLFHQLASLRPMLLRMAHLHLRDAMWAEDAVHDAMLAVLEDPQRYAGRASLGTYVAGIVKFKAVDILRRQAREGTACAEDDEQVAALQAQADPAKIHERSEFFRLLERALAQIPQKNAQAFLLREWDGCDTQELCAELGVTASNAYLLGYRARCQLKCYLETHW